MTHILALAMQKGGVGKTTTTLAVGVELAALGKRVLLVDMDPQSNLTQAIGYDPSAVAQSIYDVLLDPEAGIGEATLQTSYGVDLVPATLSLAGAELMLANRIGRELILRSALAGARDRYDYILIDTAPSLGILTVNALAAADAVIVPLQTHALALKAMGQLEETIRLVRQLNPALHLGGLVLTMHDRRTLLTKRSKTKPASTTASWSTRPPSRSRSSSPKRPPLGSRSASTHPTAARPAPIATSRTNWWHAMSEPKRKNRLQSMLRGSTAPAPPSAAPDAPAIAPAQPRDPYPLSTMAAPHLIALPPDAEQLSGALQEIARNYLTARRRTGESLLDAARWLSEARAEAQHGDWLIFLRITGTSPDSAEQLLHIHARATAYPQFAEAIRSGWLTRPPPRSPPNPRPRSPSSPPS
jgi:chromosome partitioning protein